MTVIGKVVDGGPLLSSPGQGIMTKDRVVTEDRGVSRLDAIILLDNDDLQCVR